MPALVKKENGTYTARKRIPEDVRAAYRERFGAGHEVKLSIPAGTKPAEAQRLFGQWLSETGARFDAIRAERDGRGVSLSPQQAAALAGDWHEWFIPRHAKASVEVLEDQLEAVSDVLRAAVVGLPAHVDPDELWRHDPTVKAAVRPALHDVGEVSQFLATKTLVLDDASRDAFLDHLFFDLSRAIKRLIDRHSGGSWEDPNPKRYPKFEAPDNGLSPWQLFERWVAERQPAQSTVESWRSVMKALQAAFEGRSASSITLDEAQTWITGSISEERSARTVKNTWVTAGRTVFTWAHGAKLVRANPFASVKVTAPKKRQLREKNFRRDEVRIILSAASAIDVKAHPDNAAKRWLPWVCAYTGARPGEIAQLRKCDIVKVDGVWAFNLSPDAGTIKTGEARTVPIHEHLVEQDFLAFVAQRPDGPLFYRNVVAAKSESLMKRPKSKAAQLRQRIAEWVRDIGVDAKGVSPNHGWRHTFKQVAQRHGIEARTHDYITGHSPETEGGAYGAPSLQDMADALKKFPRYDVQTNAAGYQPPLGI